MKPKLFAALASVVAIATMSLHPVWAQTYEISPYAGRFFPTEFADAGDFKDEGIYGVRGGAFVLNDLLVEGNFGYINHFEFEQTDPESRALLWEASGSYHFFSNRGPVTPFVTGGVGGLTVALENVDAVAFLADAGTVTEIPPDTTPGSGRAFQIEDNDSFFTFNYGGGVKANRLWGPLGLRFDFRGRTAPNFIGRQLTWLETTGGLTFSWGE
jgi:hypothetical protein